MGDGVHANSIKIKIFLWGIICVIHTCFLNSLTIQKSPDYCDFSRYKFKINIHYACLRESAQERLTSFF